MGSWPTEHGNWSDHFGSMLKDRMTSGSSGGTDNVSSVEDEAGPRMTAEIPCWPC